MSVVNSTKCWRKLLKVHLSLVVIIVNLFNYIALVFKIMTSIQVNNGAAFAYALKAAPLFGGIDW